MTGPLHHRAKLATLASSALVIVLITIAAAWVIVRDYHAAVEGAERHLQNFTVIAAQQTAFALRATRGNAAADALQNAPQDFAGPEGEEFQQRLTTADAALELAYSGRLALFSKDGVLQSVFPRGVGAIGRSYKTHPLFATALSGSDAGTLQAYGILEQGERLFAYRSVPDYPMVVVVSTPMSEILGRWYGNAIVLGLGTLLLVALTAMAAHLLVRQLSLTGRLTKELSESEMRLNSIIGSAMDAIITVDEKQHIVLFNAAAERIFGCSAQEAIGSPLDWLLPERFRGVHTQHVQRFGESGVTTRRMGGDLVLAGRRISGEEFPIDASISYAVVAGRKYFTVILRDITERQRALEEQSRAQRRLEESEKRLNSIIHSAMDAIITIDEQQAIVLFNAAAEKIFKCEAAQAIGSRIERFIPERYRARHREHVVRFGEADVTTRRMGMELVLAGLRSDGEEFPIDASISHVTVGGNRYYTVILRDISERVLAAAELSKSHEELREMYASMHEVREAERTRIARELHDELAQWLTALKMDASWIAKQKPEEHSKLITRAERMRSVIDNTVAAVRRIAADLRPLDLDELGVVPALENLSNSLSQRTELIVAFKSQTDAVNLREPYATALYRMVQEALTNVARHANATSVAVEIGLVNEMLLVRVQDDGQGFKPDPGRKSFGVLGIRERARTLGGEARIFSPKEGGTIVEIEIPLERRAA
jgi:PAS domain S-box-containing protein